MRQAGRAYPQTLIVEDHAPFGLKPGGQALVRVERHIARQQHFESIGAVTLAEQVGAVAQPLNHFAVKFQRILCFF